ncbi:hypothetical protein K1719_024993 [Acacia pycnantha]|nr:hypothetical protein K1719_024993 [Acacia pycnantha]
MPEVEVSMEGQDQGAGGSYKSKLLNVTREEGSNRQSPKLVLSEGDYQVGRDGDIPSIEFSREVRDVMVKGMERTLVIKLLGRTITYRDLMARTQSLWQLRGSCQIVDMVQRFYLVTFDLEEDYTKVLTGGPWTIFGAYLVVQPWSLNLILELLWSRRWWHGCDKCPKKIGLMGALSRDSDMAATTQEGSVSPLIRLPQGNITGGGPESGNSRFGAWMLVSYAKKGKKQVEGREPKMGGSRVNAGSRFKVLLDCEDLEAPIKPQSKAALVESAHANRGQLSNGDESILAKGQGSKGSTMGKIQSKQTRSWAKNGGSQPAQVYRKKGGRL